MGKNVRPSNASNPKNANPIGRRLGLTPDDQRRMAELYDGGNSCQEIADAFGCSAINAYDTLKKLGVKMRPRTPRGKIPKEKHPQIVQFYEAGQSCYDIAEKFGCSADVIHQILKNHDVKMRPTNTPGKFSEDICRKIVDLYKQGHAQKSIAARFGCGVRAVKRILDEYEVERRTETSTQFQSRFTKEDCDRIVAMHEQGISQRQIAKEIGCHRFSLTQLFRKLGIEARPTPPRHTITPEDREMIVKLRSQGKSYTEIAAKIGCCRETVMTIMRQLNVPIRVQGADAYSAEDQQRMADLYEIGLSLDEIGIGFDCGRKTILSILRKHGLKVRPQGFVAQVTPKIRDQMLALYEAGYSGAEIASKFDRDLATVISVVDLATRKLQIAQRIESMSISNAVDDPIGNGVENVIENIVENTESPAPETPPQISFETFVRNFWTDKARAVDVLLLPPDLRLRITENVKQALKYAWDAMGKR